MIHQQFTPQERPDLISISIASLIVLLFIGFGVSLLFYVENGPGFDRSLTLPVRIDSMSETAVNENLESLDSHAAKSMVDIAYTYKAFFKMARVSYSIAKILDLVAIGASFSLLSSLVELSLSNTVNIVLALLLTGISVAHRGIDFSKKGRRFEQTGDAYNSLFKDLREFRDIRIPNGEVSIKDKRTELNHLLERQKELNELTPSTWNLIYRFLDDDDVLGNIEVTEAEKNRL